MPAKEMWSLPSGSSGNSGGRQVMASSSNYGFMSSGMQLTAGSGMPTVPPLHDRSQEICKYFINGGCLRGAACPYLHELPDERHLDVNGLGFILNPNVHNAQKTVSSPQSNVGGVNSAGDQVSPTPTGSPLVVGLGGQGGGGSRHFPFGQGGGGGGSSSKPTGAKGHFGVLSAQPGAVPLASLRQPPKYRPPEPFLEHNLPPVLALPLRTSSKEAAQTLTMALLQS